MSLKVILRVSRSIRLCNFFIRNNAWWIQYYLLIDLLDIEETAEAACKALSHTILIYEAHQSIIEKATRNTYAKKIVDSWASADWFTSKILSPERLNDSLSCRW